MRYLVRATVKPGRQRALLRAIDAGSLGRGSVAEGEYLRNMADARVDALASRVGRRLTRGSSLIEKTKRGIHGKS
jgi:hypothetical protein